MKCVICDQRKSKRYCPAKAGPICPQCCGEKRVIEVDCPESCSYLQAGRERESEDFGRRLRALPPEMAVKTQRVMSEHRDVLAQIEYVLGRERLSDRNLADSDAVKALDVLLETYKTEDNGILYEKTSDDLRVEALRRELREVIEQLRNPESKGSGGIVNPESRRLSLSSAIECLEVVKHLALMYADERNVRSGYLVLLARLFPRDTKPGSILMP